MENLYLDRTRLKIKTLKLAMTQTMDWHRSKQSVVFTSGSFDLLHRGHLEYLSQAASLGDRLIIGLRSDTSIQRLRGPNRPIHTEEDRALLLASLYWVDSIVVYEEDTPLKLIQSLLPDVLVNGGEDNIENIVGAQDIIKHGGRVLCLAHLDRYSSSRIIDKINNEK